MYLFSPEVVAGVGALAGTGEGTLKVKLWIADCPIYKVWVARLLIVLKLQKEKKNWVTKQKEQAVAELCKAQLELRFEV